MPIFTVFPSWELPWALCPQAQQPRCSPEAEITYWHLDLHQRKPLVKKFWNFVHTAQIFAKSAIFIKISILSKIEYNHSTESRNSSNLPIKGHIVANLDPAKKELPALQVCDGVLVCVTAYHAEVVGSIPIIFQYYKKKFLFFFQDRFTCYYFYFCPQ